MRPVIGVNGGYLWPCGDVCQLPHSPQPVPAPRRRAMGSPGEGLERPDWGEIFVLWRSCHAVEIDRER